MTAFKKITLAEFNKNIFDTFSKKTPLLTASDGVKTNTMTIGWGTIGVMWGKNIVSVVVRPTRYTYELLEKSDTFSLSVFDDVFKEKLMLCGTNSGRDMDKFKECDFTISNDNNIPYIEQANLVITCRKIYAQDFDPTLFVDKTLDKWYPEKDYHRMYTGEIVSILVK